MSNQLFPAGREGFLDGSIDWDTATIKVSLVRWYTFVSTHRHVSEVIGAGGELVVTQTLGSKTVTNGVAGAANVLYSLVPPGASAPHMLIYQTSAASGGSDLPTSSQRLIVFIDTATGLPAQPNGGDITIAWPTGPEKIFIL